LPHWERPHPGGSIHQATPAPNGASCSQPGHPVRVLCHEAPPRRGCPRSRPAEGNGSSHSITERDRGTSKWQDSLTPNAWRSGTC
jgi:hypothetical protein